MKKMETVETEWRQDEESDGVKKVGAPVRALATKSLQEAVTHSTFSCFGAQAVARRMDLHIIKLKPRARCKICAGGFRHTFCTLLQAYMLSRKDSCIWIH